MTTTSTLTADAVELEAHYEISYDSSAYRIVDGYHLVDLLAAHRLPAGLPVVRIGEPA